MRISAPVHENLIRLFVAVELNDAVRKTLAEEQARLGRAAAGIKWNSPDLIHLTLVFLGDVFVEQVEGITRVLDAEAGGTAPFALEVTGLGLFGPPRCPRVVWAGVGKGTEAITAFQGRIDRGLRSLSLSLESRPFHPHLTLGRVKSSREARGLAAALDSSGETAYGEITVDRLLLIRTLLPAHGPVHNVIHESVLNPGARPTLA